MDSTTVRAHHDAAGMYLDPDAVAVLKKAADEAEKARQTGAARGNETDRTPRTGRIGDVSGAAAGSA
ncbi:hypothetical protein [Kitasatospora sp. NPDC087314]|uniref:hypothetical protein n=1 Tax=Kitasatospora sp. NPDC087314 TaxID=3364068 RepID=UPI00382E585E